MFVGRKRLESAVFDATVMYNDGEMGRMDIFSNLGLAKGDNSVCMKVVFRAFDRKRVRSAENQVTEVARASRPSDRGC